MKLTHKNYFTLQADQQYISSHQVGGFISCEAKEIARLRGEYVAPPNRNFLMGNYVDTFLTTPRKTKGFMRDNFNQIHNKPVKEKLVSWVLDNHPMVDESDAKKMKVDFLLDKYPDGWSLGEKKADILLMDTMIKSAKADPKFMAVMEGKCQLILEGELGGFPIKGIPDVINLARKIFVDLKTAKDFATSWDEEVRNKVPWYEGWNYWRQLSFYQHLIRQNFEGDFLPVIAGITKQDPPARGIWSFEDQDRLDRELEQIEEIMPRMMACREGKEEPVHCGDIVSCDFCRGDMDTEIQIAQSWR